MEDNQQNDYIGLTPNDAAKLAASRGVKFRVASSNGEQYMLTQDQVPGRVTAHVVDGRIAKVSIEE